MRKVLAGERPFPTPEPGKGVDIGWSFKLGKLPIVLVFKDLGSFISALLPNVYMIAGVIIFILLIFGGFTYIVSAGRAKPEGVQQGKNAITAALIGFLLIFCSWWLIQIIEAITGIKILQPEI